MASDARNPTMVADCGCPYDPEYDEGSLGWHLIENHLVDIRPETDESSDATVRPQLRVLKGGDDA